MNSIKQKLLDTEEFVDNEYLIKYVDLITRNKNTLAQKRKTNSHHILPAYYFRHHNLPVDNSESNKVNLLYRDHMLAHLYLSGCTEGRNRYWNLYSIFMMSGQRYCTDDELELLESMDEYQQLYEEAIAAAPNHRKDTHVSEETRKRMKEAQKKKMAMYGNPNKDSVWVHNNEREYMISRNEIDNYLAQGYELGRKYVHSEETIERIRSKTKGQKRSGEFRERMRENAYRTMQYHTPESHKKQGQTLHEYYKTHTGTFKGKKHTEESKQRMRDTLSHKVTVNNGLKTIRVMDYNLEKYLSKGWSLGCKPKK